MIGNKELSTQELEILPAIKIVQKSGQEQFSFNDEKLSLNVLSFWK